MHYVYVIKSIKNGSLYVGRTDDLRRRIEEHNKGKSAFTNRGKPYELVYYEAYKDSREAVKRECRLKHHGSTIGHLKKRLENSLSTTPAKRAGFNSQTA